MKITILSFLCAFLLMVSTGCVGHPDTGIVCVGMGVSAKYGSCPGAALDAQNMTKILSKYGHVTTLLNQQATKAAVISAFREAAKKDLCIFFYSGHGGSDPIGDVSGEPDRRNEYLCLYNTYMLDNEIWEIVKGAKGRVVLIFDCCHSETMFREPGVDLEAIAARAAEERGADNVQMLCWSGCPDSSYSYGGNDGGILTNAIRDSYRKDKSYKNVWARAKNIAASQAPRKTIIGKSFESNKVFQ